jgi:plastocyanin
MKGTDMHRTILLGIFAVFATGASLAACGSDTTTSTTSTGAGGGSTSATSSTGDTTSSTMSTTSTTAGSTSSASGTGGGGPTLVNGCDPTALEDHTKDATVEIKFGDATGLTYAPPCIKVKSGTMVTFTGNFAVHPLAPGETKTGVVPVPDGTSPIKATSTAVPSAAFAISPAGSYPYYCTEHYSIGMEGLIVAE